jgi:hypothetical protein
LTESQNGDATTLEAVATEIANSADRRPMVMSWLRGYRRPVETFLVSIAVLSLSSAAFYFSAVFFITALLAATR